MTRTEGLNNMKSFFWYVDLIIFVGICISCIVNIVKRLRKYIRFKNIIKDDEFGEKPNVKNTWVSNKYILVFLFILLLFSYEIVYVVFIRSGNVDFSGNLFSLLIFGWFANNGYSMFCFTDRHLYVDDKVLNVKDIKNLHFDYYQIFTVLEITMNNDEMYKLRANKKTKYYVIENFSSKFSDQKQRIYNERYLQNKKGV